METAAATCSNLFKNSNNKLKTQALRKIASDQE